MDPHKRSVTIEVMSGDEEVLSGHRFSTDLAGFKAMTELVMQWPARVWAIEGCNGIGRHVAMRLIADGEQVVDVPPKLSARHGCSPPGRDARRTLLTRTPWPWLGLGSRVCAPWRRERPSEPCRRARAAN